MRLPSKNDNQVLQKVKNKRDTLKCLWARHIGNQNEKIMLLFGFQCHTFLEHKHNCLSMVIALLIQPLLFKNTV